MQLQFYLLPDSPEGNKVEPLSGTILTDEIIRYLITGYVKRQALSNKKTPVYKTRVS